MVRGWVASLGLALIACGASETASNDTATRRALVRTEGHFADFDFARGTAFPPRARIAIGDIRVSPDAREAHVPVRLDRPTPNTVHARVLTRNGSPPVPAYEGRHFMRVDAVVVFRPGDPLVQTVRVPLKGLPVGAHFALHFPEGADGATVADASGEIRSERRAPASRAMTDGFRAPRRFVPRGRLVYNLDPARARWSDAGGPEAFSTRLPHGRTQPANAETGLYLDPAWETGGEPPVTVEGGAVVLRSQQLARAFRHEGKAWRHGAAVLTGKAMPATQIAFGQYEWEAQMPGRRGAWPALWLLPAGGGWPPEIDVYEGFGNSPDWRFDRHISANLHGGSGGRRRFTVPLRIDARRFYGLGNFETGYHRYAVDIAPDFVTWFVDGVEVYQSVNPFAGVTWFPLMNVAVKHRGEYLGGSGAMRVRALRVWRSDDRTGGGR
jgi:hypothetical protein